MSFDSAYQLCTAVSGLGFLLLTYVLSPWVLNSFVSLGQAILPQQISWHEICLLSDCSDHL